MSQAPVGPPFDLLLATAEEVVRDRPEADPEIVREVFLEAATMLDNSLVLDHLDVHDTRAVVAGLCVDLASGDPGAAVRVRAEASRAAAQRGSCQVR